MLSDVLKEALEKEIAGQPRAVQSVVRGVTRALGGLTPREGPQCEYLFIGPTGTGKTHVVRTLARLLHGDQQRLVVADCTHFVTGDPWSAFVAQMAPLFIHPRKEEKWAVLDTPPLSVILIDYLERGRPEVSKALSAALETGRISLPEGKQGSLRNCLLFITSSLCSREILDESSGIGFAGGLEDEDRGTREKLYKTCHAEAEQHFGPDLLGRLDALIIFRRLEEEHLAGILDRRLVGLNLSAADRGFRVELLPSARDFLLERGRRNLKLGSRDLVRAHRRFVEFPVADLLVSHRVPLGGRIVVEHRGMAEHLHFTVRGPEREAEEGGERTEAGREVPILWEQEISPAAH